MFFKKHERETNQNKIRHTGKKRKIIATIGLSLSLIFSRGKLSSYQSSNPNFGPQEVDQRVFLRGGFKADPSANEPKSNLNQDECEVIYEVRSEMSPTLDKISRKVRKDNEVCKGLDKLKEQLKFGEFHAGRGARKLPGTKTVFYMRSGGEARLFFRYSPNEDGVLIIVGEANKDEETKVINNLKNNYQ